MSKSVRPLAPKFVQGAATYHEFPARALAGSHSCFSGPRHVVSGASMWRTILSQWSLALAGNRNVFVAPAMMAVRTRLRNRAGDFAQVDASIRCGQGEITRLAIGSRGMGAAFLALGEALVDPITISLVGNDENAAVGRCSRSERNEGTGQNCGYRSHAAPGNERIALIG